MLGMPRLLFRYILTDLLRVLALTTAVLVTVTAFGATLKPLARDDLLSAMQVLKYIGLATVPMLQFALPFAAGFAGTMTLHRMTSDNEITAAAASGISYRRLLVPILGLGLVLTMVMVILTQSVIPRFWGVLERTIAQDVTRVFQASIERGEPFTVGRWQIWADRLVVTPKPDGVDADARLTMFRVAVGVLDDEGRIDEDVTAQRAVVDVYRRPGATVLKLVMKDVVVSQPESGMLAYGPQVGPITKLIPNVLRDDPRRLPRGRLLELRRDPDRFGRIIASKIDLAELLRESETWERANEHLRTSGSLELQAHGSVERRFTAWADRLDDRRLVTVDDRPVEIEQYEQGRKRLTIRADSASITDREAGALQGVTFDLLLEECEVVDHDFDDATNRRRRILLEDLALVDDASTDLAELSTDELLARAERLDPEPGGRIEERMQKLVKRRTDLQLEITARLWRRNATSVTALLLLALGAALAMWLRGTLPLTVYLLAFLPSVVDLILISSGDHMIREGQLIGGLAVMWSGNATLLLALLFALARLSRN
jgi:lipopolysaccharide export system permease protein